MANTETFKISAALKDLIGKELITDEFVAVFELVKNSFDANASKVEVIFENNYEPDNARIVIKDNGKGMNYDDLKNKWLFVAYSAKRLGKENEDYRDKIKTQRVFAGAKGVGRFSCDRLGRFLNLHLNPNQISATGVVQPIVNVIEVKTETGCKFSLDKQISNNGTLTNIDGIRIGATGKRYKAVNGVDIYLANNNLFYPIGFGSAIMQAIGQGGYEPPAIQNDTCWN